MVELLNLLKSTGLPVSYHHFDTRPTLPYIVYLSTNPNNFGADDTVYISSDEFNIELYTKKKDLTSEAKVETALNNAGIYWDKEEIYIESQGVFQITYSI